MAGAAATDHDGISRMFTRRHEIPMPNIAPLTPRRAPPLDNRLLAGLTRAEQQRWLPRLTLVDLAPGQVLYESGSTPAFVYFPCSAIVSLLLLTQDGDSAEFAVVGNDGMVGISSFMGGSAMPSRAVVQSAGQAWRIAAPLLRQEALGAGPLLSLLLRYTQALIAQVAQTAMCNRYHSIDERLCRRLLQGLDRSAGSDLHFTQEGMADLLGVRREGVTAAALKLQLAGVIRYRRGHIDVLDRQHLERRSCECYAAAQRECDRLQPPTGRAQAIHA
jgi:CRP-like cAMP-binding protein